MASAYRSFASGSFGSGAGPTLAIAKPAGTIDGDVLIATFIGNNSGAITPPAGWTPVFNTTSTFTKRRATSPPIRCCRRGAKDANAAQTNAASATVTGPAFTTAQPNETIVWAGFRDFTSGGGATGVTSPANLTLRATVYAGGGLTDTALWIAERARGGRSSQASRNASG